MLFANRVVPDVVAQQQRSEEQWAIGQRGYTSRGSRTVRSEREAERVCSMKETGGERRSNARHKLARRRRSLLLLLNAYLMHWLLPLASHPSPTPYAFGVASSSPLPCLIAAPSPFLLARTWRFGFPIPRNDSVTLRYAPPAVVCVCACACVLVFVFTCLVMPLRPSRVCVSLRVP